MTNGLPPLDDPALFWRVTSTSVKLMRREEKPVLINDWDFSWEGSEQWDYVDLNVEGRVRYRTWWGARRERVETGLYRHRVNTTIREEYNEKEGTGGAIPVTRESIPVLAQRALNKYHESIERASLIGDYPPKTWEES